MHSALPRLAVVSMLAGLAAAALEAQTPDGARFSSGVELINVTATVTDDDGRFAAGLAREDFTVYEDGVLQEITHFSNARVPVSLGIVLDASGSMTEEKMSAARSAIDRLIFDQLGADDELFFEEFAATPRIRQGWTSDRRAISRAVSRINPAGGTAMYDAIAEAIPLAGEGRHQKKALLVISDGNDTNSQFTAYDIRQIVRESEVMVYALGVDGTATPVRRAPRVQIPLPFPFPGGGRRRPGSLPLPPTGGGGNGGWTRTAGDRVNADALRQITDDSGGRTEIIRGFGGLDAATARLADELSRQYSLGYASSGRKDGKWHEITVKVKDRRLTVRARRGYVAS
jgi:Ca-activated chloride channel family protein